MTERRPNPRKAKHLEETIDHAPNTEDRTDHRRCHAQTTQVHRSGINEREEDENTLVEEGKEGKVGDGDKDLGNEDAPEGGLGWGAAVMRGEEGVIL